MPDTGAPWNIPYVAGTDLVADWPTDSQTLAEAVADGLSALPVQQVVSTTKTDTFSEAGLTGGGLTALVTGLTATITPSSATNKVLVTVSIGTVGNDGASAGRGTGIVLMRDATQIAVGDTAGNRTPITAAQAIIGTGDFAALTFSYLDSPATTSAVVYGVKLFCNTGAGSFTLYLNRTASDGNTAGIGRTASTITVQEIAA